MCRPPLYNLCGVRPTVTTVLVYISSTLTVKRAIKKDKKDIKKG
jgi:hypothetical protein